MISIPTNENSTSDQLMQLDTGGAVGVACPLLG
jgi:hypothetical protein